MSIQYDERNSIAPDIDLDFKLNEYPELDPDEIDSGEGQDPSKTNNEPQQQKSSTEDKQTTEPKTERRKATDQEIIEKLKDPIGTLKGAGQEFAGQKPGWGNPAAYPAAAGAGIFDFGIGLVNKVIPGEDKDIAHLPKYQHEGLQAVRDISSLIIPTIYLSKFGHKSGAAAHSKVGWKIGNDKFVQWLSRTGIGVGTGLFVDSVAPVQEREHSASGWLVKSWPRTWGWLPSSWVTLDGDSPEQFLQKNRNEGAGIGFLSDLIPGIVRFAKGKQALRAATKWIPENEKAKGWVAKKTNKIKLSDNPIENDILHSTKTRDDALKELGQSKLDAGESLNQPQLGIHDMYDYTESGVRSADDGGIVTAGISQARNVKNIDSRYGRIASILSPKNFYELSNGKISPFDLLNDLGKVFKETEVTWVGSKGSKITHKTSLREAEKLGAELYGTDLEGMKSLLRPLSKVDLQSGQRVLSREAYKGVMSAINKYSKDFINLDLTRAQGLTGTSVAGQVSDMATGLRNMENTPAVERSMDQILERLEFLMNLQGQTAITRDKAVGMADIVNRLKKVGGDLESGSVIKAIDSESNETLRALEKVANKTRSTIETLRQVKAERPQLLGPLMLAYEMTDGKVSSISSLNNFVRNSTGTVSKAFFDARADMPSAWTAGVWANIYNSILSAVRTPLKAGLSNTVLMVERPVATFAGALMQGDVATLKRAHYMYNIGIGETLQRSWSHMNQVFKRASIDPNSVGYIMRDDIARKNESQMNILRSFADGQIETGDFGSSHVVDVIESLNDLAEHPFLRFSANAMSAFDGFSKAFVGNVESRGRAYDAILGSGGKITEKRVRAMGRKIYADMFDETGMITDNAVEYASREIAMNLNNPTVQALNQLVKQVPAVKPFMMFPKTNINMLRFAGSHNPLGVFFDELNAFKRPFEHMTNDVVDELLVNRGVSLRGNREAAYNTIRAELKGRKAIGLLTTATAASLFLGDRIRGTGIFDKTRQRTRRELGWTPKTYKGLDGNWYSFEGLGAITDWLTLTTDIMDNFDTLDAPTTEVFLNRAMYIISANLTDKSFTAGLEPLGDILAGRPDALSRWGASFGSGLAPLSGMRNEWARLITPQLKELDQEFRSILANRNPITKGQLPDVYDWIDGTKVNEKLSFWDRAFEAFMPTGKKSDKLTPEKQFLIDVEWSGRPTLRTNGEGVEYSPAQRSQITEIMGKQKLFLKYLRQIMSHHDAKEFRKQYQDATDQGALIDREFLNELHEHLDRALRDAMNDAESQIEDIQELEDAKLFADQIKDATRENNVQDILMLQKIN